jgi:NAD(P)-dependent dehydrogenase (short-subunit alcohol dehydrogenase family)
MNRLAGKVALVTGAARGIGAAIARAFVDEGARVVVTDLDGEGAARTAAALGPAATARRLDVRDELAWIAATAEVLDSHGALDVLVNNAGITGFEAGAAAHDPEHAALDDWHAVLRTNLDGVFLGCKHGLRAMRRTRPPGAAGPGGSIVNISSRSGLVGIPRAAAYAASKAAVRHHSKSVALYCAEERLPIRCNSVHPAAILTPMWEPMLGPPGPERDAAMAGFVADTPLRRFGRPEEVAAVVVMLAGDESAYVTGSEVHVDGGALAGLASVIGPVDQT